MGADGAQKYPEVVTFEGIGNASLLQIHIIAASVVALGIVFAILAPPGGYVALGFFILLAAGYDLVFIRKSQKPVRVTLYLRTDPVELRTEKERTGEINGGSLVVDMENSDELGFRAAPKRRLAVWKFDSPADAKIAAKRLLEYLPKEEE